MSVRCALITGAGSGIGQATALLLAEAGYELLLLARTPAKLQATAQQIAQRSPERQVQVHAADVTDPDACRRAVEVAVERFGRLDALAHVAGYAVQRPIQDTTAQLWRRTIDTNLSAAVYLTAAAWPVFTRQHAGIIVTVSSLASVDPFPGFAMYAPAKAGVNMFTLCAGREGGPLGIRAVAVAPGAVETPMLRAMFSEQAIPPQQTLDPRVVAAVIRDCITGQRAFANGETLLLPSP